MQKPAISQLSLNQRQALIENINCNDLATNDKALLVETVHFVNHLLEDLKASTLTIHKLKNIFGFRSEQLKKALQDR